ncbi:MAG: carbon-nitrogen hydrolase family protein [Gemmatimonadota bacterium]|nr:MAG: carbon-nitrogen hydrolase family protein [Gemmatimonadota bacterium]
MTSPSHDPFLVAAVQAAPVFLDREATIDKACRLIAEAAAGGAKLAVFPECFIPTYPLWVWFIPPANTRALRELYTELLDNAVTIPSDATERLCAAARKAGIAVTIGMNERNSEASGSTLFNTTLCIGPDGNMLGKHRKIMPTAGERLVHGLGDGSTLDVYDLELGRLSCLTCWENYMPLARYAMWAWGAQIHVAPTWDRGEPWTSTVRHTAKEGRVYVISCCSALHRDDIPDRLDFKSKFLPPDLEWLNPGGSMIVDPDGKFVVEPLNEEEKIIYGEIDPRELLGPRFQLDVAGHYARPDIFELTVNREERPMVEIVDDEYVIEEEIEEG